MKNSYENVENYSDFFSDIQDFLNVTPYYNLEDKQDKEKLLYDLDILKLSLLKLEKSVLESLVE
jgi:hypothetical protein